MLKLTASYILLYICHCDLPLHLLQCVKTVTLQFQKQVKTLLCGQIKRKLFIFSVFVLAHTCTLAPNTAVVVSTEGTP